MITAQKESFTAAIPELKPIFTRHWEELALNKDIVPLDMMYETYEQREAMGEVCFVTLRDKGTIIGYFVGFISPGLHYRTCLTCITDIFYVEPDRRGARAGVMLFQVVEEELKRRGVKRWFAGEKLHKPCAPLFKYLGFEPVEQTHSKILA